jgi:hypothetical protein
MEKRMKWERWERQADEETVKEERGRQLRGGGGETDKRGLIRLTF